MMRISKVGRPASPRLPHPPATSTQNESPPNSRPYTPHPLGHPFGRAHGLGPLSKANFKQEVPKSPLARGVARSDGVCCIALSPKTALTVLHAGSLLTAPRSPLTAHCSLSPPSPLRQKAFRVPHSAFRLLLPAPCPLLTPPCSLLTAHCSLFPHPIRRRTARK